MRGSTGLMAIAFVVLLGLFCLPVLAQSQDDMGTGGDAGNSIGNATLIEVSSGNGFETYGDPDFYKFPVAKGREVAVEISTKNGAFQITLYDTNQQNVDYTNISPNETPRTVSWKATKDGFFYLKIRITSGYSATYSIEISGMKGAAEEEPEGIVDKGGALNLYTSWFEIVT